MARLRLCLKRLTLSIPPDRHRRRYAKSRVRMREYPDDGVAGFSGPRRPADYDREGRLIEGERKEAA